MLDELGCKSPDTAREVGFRNCRTALIRSPARSSDTMSGLLLEWRTT
jgi:hypothetical protein